MTEAETIIRKKLNPIFYILIFVFWLGQIWAPVDVFVTNGKENALQRFFNHPMYGLKFFYPFGVIIILLAGYLFYKFRRYFVKEKFYQRFFRLSLLVGIISLMNPNNNLLSLKFTAVRPAIFYFVYLAFLYVITWIQKDLCVLLLQKIFKIGVFFAMSRAIVSLILFMLGESMVWQGRTVTISHGDTLLWMSLFQAIFLGIYLDLKKNSYLLYSLLFLLVLILSYRRSALILSLALSIVLFTHYLYFTRSFSKRVIRIVGVFYLLVVALFILQFFPKSKLYDYVNRYTGVFSFFIEPEKSHTVHGDSGHLEQSILTTATFLDNIDRFWGRGYVGRRGFYVKGQSQAIHNSFVRVWAYFGLYMTLYLIIILFILLSYAYKQWQKRLFAEGSKPIFLKAAIIFFLVAYFIMGWFNGTSITNFLQYYTQFVLLLAVLKVDPDNVKALLGKRTIYRFVW